MQRPASRRVLIARIDHDGDVLLAGPAVRAVVASGARVTLLCGPRGVQAARALPGVAQVEVFRAPWIDADPPPVDPAELAEVVARAAGHDEALILTSFHQDPLPLALLLRLAGIARIGAISDDYPGSLLDVRHRVAERLHEVERGLSLATAMGYALPTDDDARLEVLPLRRGLPFVLPDAFVAIHPGASVPARAWAPERHRQLVRALGERGIATVVTGGPGERELTREVCAGSRALDLGGRTSFAELGEVLRRAEVVVAGNTGPAHLAAAVGTPTVSLFAPTVPTTAWRPWGVPTVILNREVPCAGCRARTCPVPEHPCLGRLTASEVIDAIGRLARIHVWAVPPAGKGAFRDPRSRQPVTTSGASDRHPHLVTRDD